MIKVKNLLFSFLLLASFAQAKLDEVMEKTPRYSEKNIAVQLKGLSFEDFLEMLSHMTKKDFVLDAPLPDIVLHEDRFSEAVSINDLLSVAKKYLDKENLVLSEDSLNFFIRPKVSSSKSQHIVIGHTLTKDKLAPFNLNGTLIGVRIVSIKKNGDYEKMGFKQNDIVLAINGVNLSKLENKNAMQALNDEAISSLKFEILRNNTLILIQIDKP